MEPVGSVWWADMLMPRGRHREEEPSSAAAATARVPPAAAHVLNQAG